MKIRLWVLHTFISSKPILFCCLQTGICQSVLEVWKKVPRSKVKDFPGPKWMKKNFKHFERVEKNSEIQEFSRRVRPVREPS